MPDEADRRPPPLPRFRVLCLATKKTHGQSVTTARACGGRVAQNVNRKTSVRFHYAIRWPDPEYRRDGADAQQDQQPGSGVEVLVVITRLSKPIF